jgi:hypothetical protein
MVSGVGTAHETARENLSQGSVKGPRKERGYVGAFPIAPSDHQHHPTCPVSGDGSSV